MIANGFNALEEKPAISVQEDNVAPFSLPQEVLTFQPDDLALISRFTGGDQERKIHCNIELRPDEFEKLKSLQEECKKRGKSYFTSITVMATRYISYARGNPEKAITMMDETQQWRTEFFGSGPLSDASLMEDLSYGVLYFTGRDFALRPILVIRAERLPDKWYKEGTGVTKLIRMLVFCMEYLRRYMFVPGKVENIVVLIDLRNLGVSQVPVAALKSIYSVLSHHYIVRVFKFYIVNMSYMLSTLVSVVKPILTDRQRQKLNFPKNVSECKEWVALHHLEEDLGGTRPKITQFFPFPLLPGPFTSGSKDGQRRDAVQNLHKAFTLESFRGRIWDQTLSKEENSKLIYTEAAEDLFNACNYPIPPDCPVKPKEPEPAPAAAEEPAEPPRGKNIISLGEVPPEAEAATPSAEAAAPTTASDATEKATSDAKPSAEAKADAEPLSSTQASSSSNANEPAEVKVEIKEEKASGEGKQCCCAIM